MLGWVAAAVTLVKGVAHGTFHNPSMEQASLMVRAEPAGQAPPKHHAETVYVRVDSPLRVRSHKGSGQVVGVVPTRSVYLGQKLVVPVAVSTRHAGYGRVKVPWGKGHGW